MTPVQVSWILVLAAGVNSRTGNVLPKQSRRVARDGGSIELLFSPWFLGGLPVYRINVILFAKALDHLPVSAAYPWLAGAGFAVPGIASFRLFQERLGAAQIASSVLIVVGISLLASR